MVKIVLEIGRGDNYTYSCTDTFPIEYESVEAAYVDMSSLNEQWSVDYQNYRNGTLEKYPGDYEFAGLKFEYIYDFENDVKMYTIDEWFALYH